MFCGSRGYQAGDGFLEMDVTCGRVPDGDGLCGGTADPCGREPDFLKGILKCR